MNLPDGVFDRPRQPRLIALNEWAIIRIETGPRFPTNIKYSIKDRRYGKDFVSYLKGDWEEFDRLFGITPKGRLRPEGEPEAEDTVYSFAEHKINPKEFQKLPNITVVPNLFTTNSQGLISQWTVLGCTMGHFHKRTALGYHIQEVYEFQTYGLMVLDRGLGEIELWVARDGDKVSVPDNCHMTLYNLGDHNQPLITLSVARASHEATKDVVRKCGPVLLGYYDDSEVYFVLNRLYINNPNEKIGVRLVNPPAEDRGRQIRISRGARLELGRLLYEQLTQNPDLIGQFAQLGIRIRAASQEAIVEPISSDAGRLYFWQPLVCAAKKGTDVYRYFFPDADKAAPPPAFPTKKRKRETEEPQPSSVEVSSHRHLQIVIEGSGDWVEQAYRPLFKKKIDEYAKRTDKNISFSVFYADDSRWKPRPDWADPARWSNSDVFDAAKTCLQPWEVYLDKADPAGFSQYLNLRPDVVFIVTPDFTHCFLAQEWLGKTPVVFVEKPFDSQITNVESLLMREKISESTTEVLGLDHYQLYALPVNSNEGLIHDHLGGYIANISFYLTETRPIEANRVRTLQYGLTLDLLPHFIAMLTYFADIGSIDEIRVKEVGQYHPLIAASRDGTKQKFIGGYFDCETYSHVQFTLNDHSGNDFRIPCHAIVGKGFAQEVKYMEVTGNNGNAIRIDLNRSPEGKPSNYPYDSLMFLQGDRAWPIQGAEDMNVTDPYSLNLLRLRLDKKDPMRLRPQLDRSRYERLLTDLLEGESEALPSTLTRGQGRDIVLALDRIWWAIRDTRPWRKYSLGTLNPLIP